MNNEMPDEIYAWAGLTEGGSWDKEPCPCGNHPEITKYIRADKTVPDGWKLVPIEPTWDMLMASFADTKSSSKIYKSMIATAPQPQTEED